MIPWGEEFLYLLVHRFQIEVALRERDRDSRFVKRLHQRDGKPALGVEIGLHKGPHPQAKIEGAFAEALEHHCGGRVFENIRIRCGDGEQDLHHLLQIGTVGDSYANLNPPPRIAQGPVHEFLRDQGCVRNDRISAIARANRARTDADILHNAGNTPDFDGIPGMNRTLKQKNQPRKKVVNDILQAETDTDAEGAGQQSEAIEVHSRHAQATKKPNSRIA